MTGLVRGLVAGLAGALVTLAAHYGLALDRETVAIVLTAVVGALASGALHWAERHVPAINRVANWLGRWSGELTLLYGRTEEPRLLGVPVSATTLAGPSNVRRVNAAGHGGHPTGAGVTEPTTGPQTPSGVSGMTPLKRARKVGQST